MLNSLKLYTNNWKIARFLVIQANYGSATSSESVDPSTFLKKEKTSKAMKAYLERSREHDLFMKQQQHEFEIGKRHLANMMGEPPENFDSQEKIDEAIRYLFPSALYEKRARPMMKPPEEIFPQRKAAEFDEAGRPFHSLFYTGKPNFFQLLHNIVACTNDCNNFEDRMIRQQKAADPSLQLDLSSTQWLTQEQLELKLMETIKPIEYDNFVNAMVRLGNHPYSYRHKDFMDIYRRPITNQSITLNVPKPKVDESGRSYITVYGCCRKSARGHVTIRAPGTGKISINGEPITFFEYDQAREQILYPLIFSDMLGKVDVEAHVKFGGESGKAGAIRYGISMGLRSFVDSETVDRMRLAGLLQKDYRRRERKKPGQEGARRKFTWKKR
ncbi:CLUMA_CG011885, isoform C [Clunio marinus]|uniref:Small ribosomal subunit protein uS9m n=1 Tax=Clunio marinus TaxID=568069 RepID=A0A1J1IE52_9DIPT|nr:CLUMA_CG011885, isoform C [Clunio marinus]